jgi:hypothetical protein
MMTTPEQARTALKELCALSKHLGKDVDLGSVKKLVMFINEVERMKLKQVPALLQPKIVSMVKHEHPALQPLDIG